MRCRVNAQSDQQQRRASSHQGRRSASEPNAIIAHVPLRRSERERHAMKASVAG